MTERTDIPKISGPANDALTDAGYTHLEQLTQVTEAEIKNLHGMGPKGMKILKQALADKGLAFTEKKKKQADRKQGDTHMTAQILFIHGAGGYTSDRKLADSLQASLGDEYKITYPRMPNENAPEAAPWKAKISKELADLKGPVILVGHSLGASALLQYLSEEKTETPISGIFLVSTPYWDAQDKDLKEYALQDNFADHLPQKTPMTFYHSHDDETIPFKQMKMYQAKLPHATFREFKGKDHQFNNDLSDVAADIKKL